MSEQGAAAAATASSAAAAWQREPSTRGREWINLLAELPLFAGLGKRHLRRIADAAKVVEYPPGEIIAQHGEGGDAFYVILAGKARVLGKGGRARNLRAGDFFGEMALLDGGPRTANVTAASTLLALRIPHRQFLKVVEREPRIALAIMRELASRVRRLEQSPSA